MRKRHMAGLSAAVAAIAPFSAWAQEAVSPADEPPSGEIIVTAQKRAERLQDVPIAMTAIGGDLLEKNGIQSTQQLQTMVPSLVYTTNGTSAVPFLRGVGSTIGQPNAEASVATHIDGVYIGLAAVGVQDLVAVKQIEVLKGPQGTLYGRNATGGTINITTRTPRDELESEFRLRFGNYNRVDISGFVSGGLTDDLAVGIYASRNSRDSYSGNVGAADYRALGVGPVGGVPSREVDWQVRGKLNFDNSAGIQLTASLEHFKRVSVDRAAFRNLQENSVMYGPPFNQPRIIERYAAASNISQYVETEQTGAMLRAEVDLGGPTLIGISGYRDSKFHLSTDFDGTEADFLQINSFQQSEQFSQEVQIVSSSSSPVKWIAGAYYFNENTGFLPLVAYGGALAASGLYADATTGPVRTKAYAAFVQATVPLGENFNVTLGGRYSVDKKRLVGASDTFIGKEGDVIAVVEYPDDRSIWRSFTPKITLDYHIGDTMVYATYSKGFKSGAYNVGGPSPATRGPVTPEKLTSWEIGSKSEFANRRVSLDFSAYLYKFKNLQVQIFDPARSASVAYLENAASAEMYGVEASLMARLLSGLSWTTSVAWQHGEFENYPNAATFAESPLGNLPHLVDLSGARMPFTPKWVISSNLDYSIALANGGSIDAYASFYHSDAYNFDPAGKLRQRGYELVNVSLGYTFPGDRLSISAFANNVTKAHYYNQLLNGPTIIAANDAAPRMYGLALKFTY